jgi:hypothetical protein
MNPYTKIPFPVLGTGIEIKKNRRLFFTEKCLSFIKMLHMVYFVFPLHNGAFPLFAVFSKLNTPSENCLSMTGILQLFPITDKLNFVLIQIILLLFQLFLKTKYLPLFP